MLDMMKLVLLFTLRHVIANPCGGGGKGSSGSRMSGKDAAIAGGAVAGVAGLGLAAMMAGNGAVLATGTGFVAAKKIKQHHDLKKKHTMASSSGKNPSGELHTSETDFDQMSASQRSGASSTEGLSRASSGGTRSRSRLFGIGGKQVTETDYDHISGSRHSGSASSHSQHSRSRSASGSKFSDSSHSGPSSSRSTRSHSSTSKSVSGASLSMQHGSSERSGSALSASRSHGNRLLAKITHTADTDRLSMSNAFM